MSEEIPQTSSEQPVQPPAEAAAPSIESAGEAKGVRTMVRELIDAGIHFGHRASRWNPKMEPYIYGKRNKIHILDVRETLKGLLRAKKFISQVVAGGDDVVFVGTKRQARHSIAEHATRCGMPYVNERWLGGTLTNFRTIRSRLGRLEELEALEANGKIEAGSKKESSSLAREKRKIMRNLGGIRTMDKIPGVMVLVDVRREHIAVREAQKVGVATVALIDTDSDPDFADLPIPGNDDAMRAIDLVLGELADAVLVGKANRAAAQEAAAKENDALKRRRTRRKTTSEQFEEVLTPTEQKIHAAAPSVLDVVSGPEAPVEPAAADAPAAPAAPAAGQGEQQG
ncbi:MAG: hypothetical protein BIFFINMI_00183 [Phycisphaerae bacterium]|nr:hypothetical protein [Phycisphaerae bacterium]